MMKIVFFTQVYRHHFFVFVVVKYRLCLKKTFNFIVRNNENSGDLVQYLIDNRVFLNKINKQGQNVLDYALEHNDSDVLNILLDNNIEIINQSGLECPLMKTAIKGSIKF